MPSYDLVLLFRQLKTPALKDAIKRSAGYVFETGATLRKMTNLGYRTLPYIIYSNGMRHHTAHYIIFDLEAGTEAPRKLKEMFALDADVMRASSLLQADHILDLHFPPPQKECTMHLDLLPPPYRSKIIALQEAAEKRTKKKNTHKNYEDKQFLIV